MMNSHDFNSSITKTPSLLVLQTTKTLFMFIDHSHTIPCYHHNHNAIHDLISLVAYMSVRVHEQNKHPAAKCSRLLLIFVIYKLGDCIQLNVAGSFVNCTYTKTQNNKRHDKQPRYSLNTDV